MWLQNLSSYGLALPASGGRGWPMGTIRIYLYSSWLKYCNDALLQNLTMITIGSLGVRSPVGYRVPALYRLLHFTRTPATYSRIFHSCTLHVFIPALPHFTNMCVSALVLKIPTVSVSVTCGIDNAVMCKTGLSSERWFQTPNYKTRIMCILHFTQPGA